MASAVMPEGFSLDLPEGFSIDEPTMPEGFSVESQMKPAKGFVDNLAPNLQEAGRILEEGFTSDPISALQSIPKALKEIGKSAKEGMIGGVVQISTGTAAKERGVQQKAIKQFMVDEAKEKILELEDDGKEGSKEHTKAIEDFDTLMTTSPDKIDLTKDTPGFSIEALQQAFKDDPGAVMAEFVNAIAEDPLLAITPLGAEKAAVMAANRVQKLGKGAQRAARVAGGVTGAAVTGAAVGGAISAAEQAAEEGEIDFGRVAEDALVMGAFSTPFGALVGLRGAARQLSRSTGVPEDKIAKAVSKELNSGASVEDALSRVTRSFDSTSKVLDEAPIVPINKTAAKVLSEGDQISLGFKQSGKVNIGLLTGTAAVTVGAALGFAQDKEFKDAVLGGVAGLAIPLGAFAVRKIGKNIKEFNKSIEEPINISRFADEAEGAIATSQRASMQLKESIVSSIPDKATREKIPFFLEGEDVKLTQSEKAIADEIKQFFKDVGKRGMDEEVIGGLLDNYVPHMWRQGTKSKSEIVQALESKGAGRISPKTAHGKERIIPTLKEGLELGLEPQTLDIAEIIKVYSDSVNRAIANKAMIKALKGEVAPDGTKLILKADDAPKGYRYITHPQLNGMKVHPEIEPSMRFMFEATDTSLIKRGALAVNFAAKRLLVSMSFFHANALVESAIFAGGAKQLSGQLTRAAIQKVTGKKIVGKVSKKHLENLTPEEKRLVLEARQGMNAPLELLKNGRAGDVIDTALKAGLKIGVIEDIGTDLFYASLKDAQSAANKIPVIGKAPASVIKMYEKANKFVDNIMWDKLATGQKLTIFMKEFEKEIIKNAKRHKKNPDKFPLESPEAIAADIAEFVNDAFGGLNWRKIAEGIDNKFLRNLTKEALSPSGRKNLQLALFAPDWTIANVRVLGKAIPGVARNKRVARFHQMYFLRASILTMIGGDAINVMMSGHHFWENEDPFMLDLGDGRKAQVSKQFVEPFHWATDPIKTARNKMGILPKEVVEQAIGVKYLTKGGGPAMKEPGDRAKNLASNFVPIWVQQVNDQGLDGLAGFLGHPIYGEKE